MVVLPTLPFKEIYRRAQQEAADKARKTGERPPGTSRGPGVLERGFIQAGLVAWLGAASGLGFKFAGVQSADRAGGWQARWQPAW
jgi:hypothetical protein